MSRNSRLLDKAVEIAKKSTYSNHKVGCIITNKKGNIISIGYNIEGKSHPKQKEYALRAGEERKEFLHAEISALVKCRDIPYNIYVARLTAAGNIGLAKPCPICKIAIEESGVKNVYYTRTDKVSN